MKNKSFKIAKIILATGLVVAIVANFLTSIKQKPTVTEKDFEYSVTYKLDGETKTINGVYNCRFSGYGENGVEPLNRYYEETYTVDGKSTPSQTYTIAQKDTVELYIVTLFNNNYLMGDTKNEDYNPSLVEPYLEAVDSEGYSYDVDESELLSRFDAEIISWEYPDPIENSFVFAGFSGIHPVSALVMLIVGLLTLVFCMIIVKKEEVIKYNSLDTIGIVLNFIAMFIALPFIAVVAYLIQAFQMGVGWIYQVDLCIPAIVPFSVATSVALRRNGYRIIGFLIQFLGPVLFIVSGILEHIL